jgi:hypothetical protein
VIIINSTLAHNASTNVGEDSFCNSTLTHNADDAPAAVSSMKAEPRPLSTAP